MTEQTTYKVAVAVPCGNMCPTGFAWSLANLTGFTMLTAGADKVIDLYIMFLNSTYIDVGRQGIVKEAMQQDMDFILWLDSDMKFPKDALIHLLNRNKHIVGANYSTRKLPARPVTFKKLQPPGVMGVPHDRCYTEEGSTGIEVVDAAGFGVMLTHCDVFRTVPFPHFRCDWVPERGGHVGEDVYFCLKAKEYGFDTYIDHDLSKAVAHIGEMEYTIDHTIALREEAEAEDWAKTGSKVKPVQPKIEVVSG